MQRIRYFLLAIVCFFTAILIPGTFVNRLLSTLMCAVFSFNWGACTVNLAKTSDRVVAAFPPSLEKNIDNWFTQRSGEFDDESSPPAPVNNQQVPPFPVDPGPNIIRPEFDDPGSSSPVQPEKPLELSGCSLSGTWVYSLYETLSDQALLSTVTLEIKQNEDGEISVDRSNTVLQNQQSISQLIYNPVETTTTEIVENLKITQKTTVDGAVIYGDISDQKSGKSIFFVMERKTACVADHQPLSSRYSLEEVKVANLVEKTMIA